MGVLNSLLRLFRPDRPGVNGAHANHDAPELAPDPARVRRRQAAILRVVEMREAVARREIDDDD